MTSATLAAVIDPSSKHRTRRHTMPFGAEITATGAVRFRLFAPAVDHVSLALDGRAGDPLPLTAEGDGWFSLTTAEAGAGSRYRFVLPDGFAVPDPASRYQPEDVHGPSEVIDPESYAWNDAAWRGRPWEQAVLYELHVGTFTTQGTFRAAMEHLDHLAALGITAIALMALWDFAGNRNWGYDGVLLFAADSAYGRPEEVKAFIDAAHACGMMVIIDVVYNHFGPEGNYLHLYFPQISSEEHCTPWGKSLNFDGKGTFEGSTDGNNDDTSAMGGHHSHEVRELIIHNALYWIQELHADGLRLDASHAMIDESPRHILEELRDRVVEAARGSSPEEARIVHLILENEDNIAERLGRDHEGLPTDYTAQWNHDITHLLAAVLGKPCEERRGDNWQERDAGETERLGKALANGFVIAAEEHGRTDLCKHIPPTAYIGFIQTHDLIGNRIFGDRLAGLITPEALRAIAAIALLFPQIPMLFMGEEWASTKPFPFFSDYHGELADAVKKGRREQLSKQDPRPSDDEMRRAPDPQAESTLRSAQLDWTEREQPDHARMLAWYTRILAVRQQAVVPLLKGLVCSCGHADVLGPGALTVRWTLAGGAELHLQANLCTLETTCFPQLSGKEFWLEGSASAGALGPWSVRWSIESGPQS